MSSSIGIDAENLTDKDIQSLMSILDTMSSGMKITIFKLSKSYSHPLNSAEVRRLGLPYTDIAFVNFEDYSLRTNDIFDTVMQRGPDIILFTRNYDLSLMLTPHIEAVFLLP